MRFEVEIDRRNRWSWRLVDDADETIMRSGRTYASCEAASGAAVRFCERVSRAAKALTR